MPKLWNPGNPSDEPGDSEELTAAAAQVEQAAATSDDRAAVDAAPDQTGVPAADAGPGEGEAPTVVATTSAPADGTPDVAEAPADEPGKSRGRRARDRFANAAADARGRASSAASDARDKASTTDVGRFAHHTTSLIDTARPFFLAGFAAVFSGLGFLEGDSGTSQLFVFGALVFVLGAAFSNEITEYLADRLGRDRDDDER